MYLFYLQLFKNVKFAQTDDRIGWNVMVYAK